MMLIIPVCYASDDDDWGDFLDTCASDDDDWGDFLDTCASELSDRA